MTIKYSKGFTIIELLVVVAIIAVLAAIVLVNVTGYINQGKNAAIKGNMSTALTNAAVYYDSNANYAATAGATNGFCADTNLTWDAPRDAATSAGGTVVQYCTSTTFCACSTLKDVTGAASQTYCVDSTGYKKQTATACASRCSATVNTCVD